VSVSANLLSAVSLALAVLAAFYSLWWVDIEDARNAAIPQHMSDRGPVTRQLQFVKKARATPIALSSLTLAVVMAPPAISVIARFIRGFVHSGFAVFRHYNAVPALYEVVWIAILAIAISSLSSLRAIRVKLQKATAAGNT
jgi:hypothetical protein